jgi:hypothetical protein
LRGYKLKALSLAFAFLVSVGPACAGEIASPAHAAKIGETPISRMYRVAWLAKFGRQQAALEAKSAPNKSEIHALSKTQSAVLYSSGGPKSAAALRVQAIAAQIDQQMRVIAAGRPLTYQLHVDCSSKSVTAARPPQGTAPEVLAAFGSDVESVKVSVDSCTLKVAWKFLDEERRSSHVRAYSVSLPLEASAH